MLATDCVIVCAQTWVMMLGYLHKDSNMPHFRKYYYNIRESDVDAGVIEWKSAKLSYEDDKIVISRMQMFMKPYSYYVTYCNGEDISYVDIMMRMLNSGKFVLASGFVSGTPIRQVAVEAMWKNIIGKKLSYEEVKHLLFAYFSGPRPGSAVAGDRYFDAPAAAPTPDTPFTPIRVDGGALETTNPEPPPKGDRETFCLAVCVAACVTHECMHRNSS